jgi:hypothetical protein
MTQEPMEKGCDLCLFFLDVELGIRIYQILVRLCEAWRVWK